MTPQAEGKPDLRKRMLAERGGVPDEERRSAALALVEVWRRERPVGPPGTVAAYWPMRGEIDIRPLAMELFGETFELALPTVVARDAPLLFRAWRPGDRMVAGPFGTLEPEPTRHALEPDALLVPLLAADDDGWRLGYGGGFYDRTLAALRARARIVAIGVGFHLQRVPAVPHGPGDARLDWLLTERGACAFV